MCNNFGKFNSITKQCDCQSGYAGQFCDVCDHPSYEYPDCTGEFDADLMDSSAYNAFYQRRAQQLYHKDYHRNDAAENPFQQQCAYTDFPNHLN